MATNLDLTQVLPGTQEVSIFMLDSADGTVVTGVNELGNLNIIYNGVDWVFGSVGAKLYFLYRTGTGVKQVAIFDATNGTTDLSELAAGVTSVKYTTLEANKWRIKGITNGVTYSSENTAVVFEYSSTNGASWVAAAKLSAIV